MNVHDTTIITSNAVVACNVYIVHYLTIAEKSQLLMCTIFSFNKEPVVVHLQISYKAPAGIVVLKRENMTVTFSNDMIKENLNPDTKAHLFHALSFLPNCL